VNGLLGLDGGVGGEKEGRVERAGALASPVEVQMASVVPDIAMNWKGSAGRRARSVPGAGGIIGRRIISSRHAVAKPQDAGRLLPCRARELLVSVDEVILRKLAEFVFREEPAAQLAEAVGECLAHAVGVADNEATGLHKIAELLLLVLSELKRLAAGNVQYGDLQQLIQRWSR